MYMLQSQISKNSSQQKPISLSQRKSKKQIIIHLTKQFTKNFNQHKKDIYSCINQFLTELNIITKIKLTFDNSVSNILSQLSYQKQFLQFNNFQQNQLKKSLQIINECLRQKNFISQRQCNKFKNVFLSSNLEQLIYILKRVLQDNGFIQRKDWKKGEKQISFKKVDRNNIRLYLEELKKLWNDSMKGVSIQHFWAFILDKKIQFKQLFPIFKVYEYVVKIQVSLQLRSSISTYLKQYLQRIKKQQCKVEPLRKLEKSIIQYDFLLEQKAQYISAYLQKQRWAKYTEQYESVIKYLSSRCNKSLKFQAYGSFRNKFYIINFSDIDIGLFYQGKELNNRANICNLLVKIKQILDQDKQHISNYLYSKAFTFDKIHVPFLKIQFKTDFGQNKDIVPSMDIIINKKDGLQNSILLSKYAEQQYILKFCNLIKYWAAKRDLINMKQKIEGLSSYGIILMALYYLMSTKQIPFLKITSDQKQKYQIGRQKFNIRFNYHQNFIGFLKFYSLSYKDSKTGQVLTGQFHINQNMRNNKNQMQVMNKIVCLLQPETHYQLSVKVYNRDYIINMYDFIDGTNPGRMRTYLKDKFTGIFSDTLECLEERSLSFLQMVYSQENISSGWNKQKNRQKGPFQRPKRGNRF